MITNNNLFKIDKATITRLIFSSDADSQGGDFMSL